MTYGAVRLFANELVSKRGVRTHVRRSAPFGDVCRIKRYLQMRGWHCQRVELAVKGRQIYRIGRIPVTELRHVSHDKNILLKICQSMMNDEISDPGYLSEKCVRVHVEQHRCPNIRHWLTCLATQCARVHRDRVTRANGDVQAAIRANNKAA